MMEHEDLLPRDQKTFQKGSRRCHGKIYPGCKVRHFDDSYVNQGDGYINVGKV